jgi:hypothetical protein
MMPGCFIREQCLFQSALIVWTKKAHSAFLHCEPSCFYITDKFIPVKEELEEPVWEEESLNE